MKYVKNFPLMTAKEFCEQKDEEIGEYWSNDYDELPLVLIEFAKMHVKEALYQAANSARIIYPNFGCDEVEINKETILNAYPENLIE